jgi:hypothetical protein
MPMAWREHYSAAPWLGGARSLPPKVTNEILIAKAAPRAPGEVMILSPHDIGTYKPVHKLKATTLTFSLTHDVFVVCASMMPEPRHRGHMATVTPRSVGSLSFSGWQEHLRPLLTRDPAVYAT